MARYTFPLFRFIWEGRVIRVPVRLAVIGLLAMAFVVTALLHFSMPWWLVGITLQPFCIALAYFTLIMPCSLVEKQLRTREIVDVRVHEMLVKIHLSLQRGRDVTDLMLQRIVETVEKLGDPNADLHLLTPNAIYLCADTLLQHVKADPEYLVHIDPELLHQLETVSKRCSEIRKVIEEFPGEVHLILLDRTRQGVRDALTRREALICPPLPASASSAAHQGREAFLRKYRTCCANALDLIQNKRALVRKRIRRFEVTAFPRVRLLCVISNRVEDGRKIPVDGTCFSQELPERSPGIMVDTRELDLKRDPDIFRNVTHLVEMLESGLDLA